MVVEQLVTVIGLESAGFYQLRSDQTSASMEPGLTCAMARIVKYGPVVRQTSVLNGAVVKDSLSMLYSRVNNPTRDYCRFSLNLIVKPQRADYSRLAERPSE